MTEYKPLRGLRMLDLTRAMAGPFCTMILGDLGADITKVEPLAGDMTRTFAPRTPDGSSAYFLSANRNKRSICLDYRSQEGLDVLARLAENADVVVENFRPGVMESIGLSYAELSQRDPSVIMASVSGYGRGGPYEDWPGVDQIAQGMSGMMYVTGNEQTGPLRTGLPIADITTGMWTAIGVLSAALDRKTTGVGQHVHTSLLGGALGLMTMEGQRYLSTGELPRGAGNDHPMVSPYGVFEAKDGPLVIGGGVQKRWLSLCEAIGRPELATRPDYVDNVQRVKNRAALTAELNTTLRHQDRAYWIERLIAAGVPTGPVLNMDKVVEDPHVQASGRLVVTQHPTLGALQQIATPICFGDSLGIAEYAPPPLLGQHSVEILEQAGLSGEDIAGLLARGTVVQSQETA